MLILLTQSKGARRPGQTASQCCSWATPAQAELTQPGLNWAGLGLFIYSRGNSLGVISGRMMIK